MYQTLIKEHEANEDRKEKLDKGMVMIHNNVTSTFECLYPDEVVELEQKYEHMRDERYKEGIYETIIECQHPH